MKAFSKGNNRELLADIKSGTLGRRIGPAVSRRIHDALCSEDPNVSIVNTEANKEDEAE
jgi:hypothetical protein